MELIQALHIQDGSPIADAIAAVPETHLPIIEMFYGIEGEGSFIGEPRILLRIGGCRVGCIGCDTPHSWGLKSSVVMPLDQVFEQLDQLIDQHKVQRVAITGGEPMHYPEQLAKLVDHLDQRGVLTWLETSGLIFDYDVMRAFDFISFDVKTPSSGPACFNLEAVELFKLNVRNIGVPLHVKMIVTGQNDCDWITEHFSEWLTHGVPGHISTYANENPVIITPACGRKSTLAEVRDRMLLAQRAFEGFDVRIIAQQHALLQMQ